MEEEVGKVLTRFSKILREEILEYYNRCYDYMKDLFADKQIDLKFKTNYESAEKVQETLEKMVKSIRIALNTIGVSKARINQLSEIFDEFTDLDKKKEGYKDYNAYFVNDLKSHITFPLLEIIIEYLIDRDPSKIENLDLFDLLPRNFIQELDQFKDQFITSTRLKRLINQELLNIDQYLDPSTVEPTSDRFSQPEEEKEIIAAEKPSEERTLSSEVGENEDLLEKLRLAKETNIEALKASIKSSAKPETPLVESKTESATESTVQEGLTEHTETIPQKDEPPKIEESPPAESFESTESTSEISQEMDLEPLDTEAMFIQKSETFLDDMGEFPEIKSPMLSDLNINRLNLITSRDNDPDLIDLENLYYYISILNMLNVDLPFTEEKIISLLDDYTEDGIFIPKPGAPADPISIFYGLSILSEYGLVNKTAIIDLLEVEMFLEEELQNFTPEKLHLNFYTLLSLRILEKNGSVITPKNNLLNPTLNLRVRDFEKYNPPLDIFEKLGLIKLLDPTTDVTHFKGLYTKEIKNAVLDSESKINITITNAARAILALKLLDVSKKEFKLSHNLCKYIGEKTNYFSQEAISSDFNWKKDKLAYKVELRMLYWALISCY